MGEKVAGTAYVKVDGEQMVVTGNVETPLAKVKRETITKGHFKEEDAVPYVSGEFVIPKGLNIEKIMNGTNMTVTVELKSGRTYVLSGAYVVDEPALGSDEGKASIKFEGTEGDFL